MKSPQYITIGPEHLGTDLTAFGERWILGKIEGGAGACGFVREDIGKRLYLMDGHLVLKCQADAENSLNFPAAVIDVVSYEEIHGAESRMTGNTGKSRRAGRGQHPAMRPSGEISPAR